MGAPKKIRFSGRIYVQAQYDEKTKAFQKAVYEPRERFEKHLTEAHTALQEIVKLLEEYGYEKPEDKKRFRDFVEMLDKIYYGVQYGTERTGWIALLDRLYPLHEYIPQPGGPE